MSAPRAQHSFLPDGRAGGITGRIVPTRSAMTGTTITIIITMMTGMVITGGTTTTIHIGPIMTIVTIATGGPALRHG